MPSWWSEPNSKHAYVLSWISVIVTLFAAVAGIAIYVVTGSALILSFGLENCVDLLSSLVVLWRFYCPSGLDSETEKHLMKREKRASIAISFILALLGIGIVVAAADDFSDGPEDLEKYELVMVISFFSILIFGTLAIFKFHYSIKLQSASLHKDGVCSLIGTVLAGALFINTLIIEHVPSAWWIDPAVALACGIVSIVFGMYGIIMARFVQKIPIFSPKWWFVSQGDGTDEITGRGLGPEDLSLSFNDGADETEMTTKNLSFNDGADDTEMTTKNDVSQVI